MTVRQRIILPDSAGAVFLGLSRVAVAGLSAAAVPVYLTAFMTPAGETGNDVITLTTQFGSTYAPSTTRKSRSAPEPSARSAFW